MAETTRITALSMLTEADGQAYLAELYGRVIEGVQKALISGRMKNMDLSGDPVSGTVEAKRFVNAESQDYGDARTAGRGNAVKAKPVTVAIDRDKEFVEELEQKDVRLYGVEGVLERRAANHILRMATELDNAFFLEAYTHAQSVEVSNAADAADVLETIIQACETTKNDFVDGVPRAMMNLVLSPKWYGKIRKDIDTQTNNASIDTAAEEIGVWHGVRTDSCVHLPGGVDILLLVDGSVAQPVMADQYVAEKIPLSNAYGIELFYHYGTKAVTPDLIFTPEFVENPNVRLSVAPVTDETLDLLGKTCGELQSNIKFKTTSTGNNVSGKLKYVTGYTGFDGANTEYQSGNYLAFKAIVEDGTADHYTAELVGGILGGEVALDSDMIGLFRITNKTTQSIKIRAYDNGNNVIGTYETRLSGLTLVSE